MTEVVSMDPLPQGGGSMGSPMYGASHGGCFAADEQLPNPDFTFPARSAEQTERSAWVPPSAPRPRHGNINSRRSAHALPAFSFNPSGTEPVSDDAQSAEDAPKTPPPQQTQPLPITPSRHMGHRRGGSEFIGGDGRSGATGLLSSSPTKTFADLPPPSAHLGPPAGRRGHAHRRSGAISCHDLQSILQPRDANGNPRAGSAPVTPMENEHKAYFNPESRRSMSQHSLKVSSEPSSPPPESVESSPRKVVPRVRVGFSDRVEYIRPLSTISSETESSLSTIRGHSVNGSLSSVVSVGTASPASVRTGRTSLQTTFEDEKMLTRPSTASDILDSASPGKADFGDSLSLPERPKSAAATESPTAMTPLSASPVKAKPSNKRLHLGWFDTRKLSRTHSRNSSGSFPTSRSEPSLVATPPETPGSPADRDLGSGGVAADLLASNPKAEGDRRPRKARSWAHSFMSLRYRQKAAADEADDESSLASTPQARTPAAHEEIFALVPDFDADNTVDIVSAPSPQLQPQSAKVYSPCADDEASGFLDAAGPTIDLDAALGPFNVSTPGSRNQFGRPAGFQRRSMHSSSMTSGAFGLQQPHRRTESAPALVPFDGRATRVGVQSPMADVFEEEEEDEYNKNRQHGNTTQNRQAAFEQPQDDPEMGIQIVDSSDGNAGPECAWTFEDGSNASNVSSSSPTSPVASSLRSAPSQQQSPDLGKTVREDSPVEVVEAHEEPRTDSFTRDSDSTITPPVLPESDMKRPPSFLNFSMPLPPPSAMTPDTLSSSPLSTPDFGRSSRPSFENPRIGTAASSFTDAHTMSSFALGEPMPDFRGSVEDVPSLTSSRSTMTTAPRHPLSRAKTYGDSRSISMGSIPSTGMERARKRGSIVSLSRLVSSSLAERSKLSIESRPQSERGEGGDVVQKQKKKKNRISRLMTFWKNKESFDT